MRFLKIAMGIGCLSIALSCQAQQYHIVDHWKIGGEGGWDYLLSDDAAHRLYVSHNTRVEVLDTSTGKFAGAVTGLKSTHGIALNPDGRTGYMSDGAGNAIVVFDRRTLAVLQTVPAEKNPDGIVFEPVTKTVWAFNGHSHSVTVMDSSDNTIVATIPLPGKPEFPQADGKGHVFDNIEDRNSIVELDARSHTMLKTWKLSGCSSPSGMAIDRKQHRLFSVCDGGRMAIVDYETGKILGLASIGDSPDAAGFDPKTGYAFSSNGDGTLSIIDTNKPGFPTVQTLQTVRGARTMAFDAATGKVFLSSAKQGTTPAPTAAAPKPRRSIMPDSFEIIVAAR